MNGYLKARDAISGQEGMAYIEIDGQNKPLFHLKTLEATMEKEKSDFKSLGKRVTQHKTTGVNGTGSMTLYAGTPLFLQMADEYVNKGIDKFFTIRVVNEDPSSSVGRQAVLLTDVNLDSWPIANLDVDSEYLEFDTDFTFDGFTPLEVFKDPEIG